MEFGTLPLAVETKRKLAGFFETGQLPHALLLEGGTAAARQQLAEILSAGAVCRRAVSYTHLDVYKRQAKKHWKRVYRVKNPELLSSFRR